MRKSFLLSVQNLICFITNTTLRDNFVHESIKFLQFGVSSVQYRNGWLAASDLFQMFTQSIKFYTFHYQYKCLKNVIHQIDSKNGWLLLSASFTAKFGLVFVLTQKKAFSQRFHFQYNRKSIGSSKKLYQVFQNSPPFKRSACFYVTISENFEHVQYFNVETAFLEKENFFQKTGVLFFS